MATRNDMFSNILTSQVNQTAANSFTVQEIQVGLNLFDKVGLVLHRVEYQLTNSALSEMTSANDRVALGLINNQNLTGLDHEDSQVLDSVQLYRSDFGTAGSAELNTFPIIRDFTGLPGTGLLIPPKPLFFAMDSVGLATASLAQVRIYFTIRNLKDSEYLELLETRRAFG